MPYFTISSNWMSQTITIYTNKPIPSNAFWKVVFLFMFFSINKTLRFNYRPRQSFVPHIIRPSLFLCLILGTLDASPYLNCHPSHHETQAFIHSPVLPRSSCWGGFFNVNALTQLLLTGHNRLAAGYIHKGWLNASLPNGKYLCAKGVDCQVIRLSTVTNLCKAPWRNFVYVVVYVIVYKAYVIHYSKLILCLLRCNVKTAHNSVITLRKITYFH